VREAVQKLGGLDIVVCNAGRQQSKPSILEVTDEDFDATMKTNFYQGGDDELRQITREAGGTAWDPRQCRRPGTGVDAAADQRGCPVTK